MSKELWGDPPVNKEFENKKTILKKNANTIAKSFAKYFNRPIKAESFVLVDFYQELIIAEPATAKFYVNMISDNTLSNNQLQFYHSIYSSNQKTPAFVFPEEKKVFNKFFEKLSIILSTFYAGVEVIYMGQVEFSRPYGSLLNMISAPKMEIFQDSIKIMGIAPRFKHLDTTSDKEKKTNVVNLFGGHEMEGIVKFINQINMYAIPEGSDITISIDDDIEDLKRNLALIGMCLV
jgi:hypothetical protein